MLCATRAIGRKALECSGIGTEYYTQRNFSTILKNVSVHFIWENEWKSFVTWAENVKNFNFSFCLVLLLVIYTGFLPIPHRSIPPTWKKNMAIIPIFIRFFAYISDGCAYSAHLSTACTSIQKQVSRKT